MGLRSLVERRIQGEEPGADPLDGALRLASWVYRLGVFVRGWCFEHGILYRNRLSRPVISVGNLSVGGTGKTPLVISLGGLLKASGHSVAVLSRGYGRKQGGAIRPVSDGERLLCSAEEAGDEPLMMAHRLTGVWIWVGPDRHRTGVAALERCRPDVFLLDDGFQHRRLHRDLDIVVMRVPHPLGNGKILPAGPLREPPEALKRANLIVMNLSGTPSEAAEAMRLVQALCPSVPIISAMYRPHSLWQVGDGRVIPLGALRGRRVAMVCGIGHPHGLRAILDALGAQVVRSLLFPDHYWYTPLDVERIRAFLPDVDAVVTTEKDAWKLRDQSIGNAPVWALRMDLEVQEENVLVRCIDHVLRPGQGRL